MSLIGQESCRNYNTFRHARGRDTSKDGLRNWRRILYLPRQKIFESVMDRV
jgi:hypothetical protein